MYACVSVAISAQVQMDPLWGVGERWAGAEMRSAMEWMLIAEAERRIDAALQRFEESKKKTKKTRITKKTKQ